MSPPRVRRSPVLRVLASLGVYALLVVCPGLADAHAQLFRAMGTGLFGAWFENATVRLERVIGGPDAELGGGIFDTRIVMFNGTTGTRARAPVNARSLAYLPSALIVALVAASPVCWRRRGRALLWGLLLIQGFSMLRLGIKLLHDFCTVPGLALYSPPYGLRTLLAFTREAVVTSALPSFLVPAVLWVLVTFRRGDGHLLTGAAPLDRSEKPQPALRKRSK